MMFPVVAGLWGQKWNARPRFWWALSAFVWGGVSNSYRGLLKDYGEGWVFRCSPMAFIAPRVPSCPLFASVHLPMSHRNPSLLPGPRWLWKQVRHECGGIRWPLCILQWWPPDSPGDMICYPLSSFHLSLSPFLLSYSPFLPSTLPFPSELLRQIWLPRCCWPCTVVLPKRSPILFKYLWHLAR